jgi:hypothetical protein
LAWRISEESFFKENVPWVNNFKLRSTIGLTGNDNIDAAQWYAQAKISDDGFYNDGTSVPTKGTSFSKVPNPSITWEKTVHKSIGADLGFLNNLFTLGGEYWFKHTFDILGSRTADTPDTFGGKLADENYGIVDAFGFNFELGFNKKINKDWSVWARGNFGWADNKLLRFAENNVSPWVSKIGSNYDRIAGLVSDGVIWTMKDTGKTDAAGYKLYDVTTSTGGKYTIPQNYYKNDTGRWIDNGGTNNLRPGSVFMKDLGGIDADGNHTGPDGYITSGNADYAWKIDHLNPPYNYGLLVGGNWKGFSLDVFLQGTAGNQKTANRNNGHAYEWNSSDWAFVLNDTYSILDNPTGKYPMTINAPSDGNLESDFWVRNAGFIRLKNVTLAYDLPKSLLAKAGIAGAKVYVNGTNLALLWNQFKWYDPEMGSRDLKYNNATSDDTGTRIVAGGYNYPLTRTVTFGLNVSF